MGCLRGLIFLSSAWFMSLSLQAQDCPDQWNYDPEQNDPIASSNEIDLFNPITIHFEQDVNGQGVDKSTFVVCMGSSENDPAGGVYIQKYADGKRVQDWNGDGVDEAPAEEGLRVPGSAPATRDPRGLTPLFTDRLSVYFAYVSGDGEIIVVVFNNNGILNNELFTITDGEGIGKNTFVDMVIDSDNEELVIVYSTLEGGESTVKLSIFDYINGSERVRSELASVSGSNVVVGRPRISILRASKDYLVTYYSRQPLDDGGGKIGEGDGDITNNIIAIKVDSSGNLDPGFGDGPTGSKVITSNALPPVTDDTFEIVANTKLFSWGAVVYERGEEDAGRSVYIHVFDENGTSIPDISNNVEIRVDPGSSSQSEPGIVLGEQKEQYSFFTYYVTEGDVFCQQFAIDNESTPFVSNIWNRPQNVSNQPGSNASSPVAQIVDLSEGDGSGGSIGGGGGGKENVLNIFWVENNSGVINGQSITEYSGTLNWEASGAVISSTGRRKDGVSVVVGEKNENIVVWHEGSSGSSDINDIFAAMIDQNGDLGGAIPSPTNLSARFIVDPFEPESGNQILWDYDECYNGVSFEIQRSLDDDDAFEGIATTADRSFLDSSDGLNDNTEYNYKVTAVRLRVKSDPASISSETPVYLPPHINSLEQVGSDRIDVYLTNNSNRGQPIIIERSAGERGFVIIYIGTAVPLFQDRGISFTTGEEYSYRASTGDGRQFSPFSNIASITFTGSNNNPEGPSGGSQDNEDGESGGGSLCQISIAMPYLFDGAVSPGLTSLLFLMLILASFGRRGKV